MKTVSSIIGNIDFIFEHSPIKIVANRNCPEIELAGLVVGPFEEGNEYEVQFWIAQELEKTGIARFREEEVLDAPKLYKIQWTERVQTAGQISKLPENFYSKLRRHLTELKNDAAQTPEKLREYEKIKHLTRDTVNSRLKKIVSLASAPAQTEQLLKNLTPEERFLYGKLYKLISEWRIKVLDYGGDKE
ncbi:DNA replication complex GINS family protein [Candidatus Bathyarchaeota archaeon]|nr:DNA replication complex GINS family protein [Candidatus Bathyarchaeota archaeon]